MFAANTYAIFIMNQLFLRTALVSLMGLGACSGSSSGGNNLSDIQARVDALNTCLPDVYQRLQLVLDVVETWRLNTSAMMPDPTGLTWMERTDGVLQVDYAIGGGLPAVDMQITFFNAAGVPQNIDLATATSLSSAIELAASELAVTGGAAPFLVADWSLRDSGAVIFGAGSLTAVIGGTVNQKELVTIFTSLGSVVAIGGPPAASTATIATALPMQCVATVNVSDLRIDTSQSQLFPEGVVRFDIMESAPGATITATVTLDGSNMAAVSVANVPTSFTLNLDTLTVE